jgi:hypothetical protein
MLSSIQNAIFHSTLLRRLFFGGVLLVLFVFLGFAAFYYFSDYETLKHWFLSMNDCFYRNTLWTKDFFTPAVKAKGNLFVLAAMIICLTGILYIIVRRKKYFTAYAPLPKIPAENTGWKWYIAVLALGLGAWYWGQGLAKPSADEIFSGVNCAELPPFQVLAYYMLPNNHVYFNFFNGYLSRWSNIDVVQSGRILSMLAYIGVLCLAFHWFSKLFRDRIWAFIALIPIAFQFTTWAMGFQARGYESQLFCCWAAFLSIFRYIDKGDIRMLRINTFFCIFGFAFVPTFLYFYIAQVAFMALLQLFGLRIDLKFWKYQMICLAGVFLLYLPALCFSGLDALAGNDYVKVTHVGAAKFFPNWYATTQAFASYMFSSLAKEGNPVNFLLLAIPLVLFVFPQKEKRLIALFYLVLWLVWTAICFKMERYPFNRNMLLHYSLTLAIIIYTCFSVIAFLFAKISSLTTKNILKAITFGVPLLAFSAHLMIWGKPNAPFFLYFMNVNYMYTDYKSDIDSLPPNSTVNCSDERYCFYYYCRLGPFKTTRCLGGNEDFYVKTWNEPLPPVIAENYRLFKVGTEGSQIFKHK